MKVDSDMSKHSELVDVCIIGAGWSGLLSCKYALEKNLSVTVLERRGNLGGVCQSIHLWW
jgi:phytoene dehydrogenase-like protein